MKEKDGFGIPGFLCVGVGGVSAIFGLLAIAALRAMGEPKDTPGLKWEEVLWGFPFWIASTLGPFVSWLLFIGGASALTLFIINHSRKRA